jgi:hypothetical protein
VGALHQTDEMWRWMAPGSPDRVIVIHGGACWRGDDVRLRSLQLHADALTAYPPLACIQYSGQMHPHIQLPLLLRCWSSSQIMHASQACAGRPPMHPRMHAYSRMLGSDAYAAAGSLQWRISQLTSESVYPTTLRGWHWHLVGG